MDQYTLRLQKIEACLRPSFPSDGNRTWISRVTGPLPEGVSDDMIARITAPGVDLLERGGKRWRPLLMMLVCGMFGGDEEIAAELAPVVELPHNGSLIVDDIEDCADQRRGKPAVHILYGTDMAINTGNFLYFSGTELLENPKFSPDLRLKLVSAYLQEMRRLHIGQGLDIQWHNDHEFYPRVDAYLQMCAFKTGGLSRMAGRFGALLAGRSGDEAAAGHACGQLGVGFQILDDIKNLTTGNPGKKRGDDIVEGKKSLPVVYFSQLRPRELPRLAEIFISARQNGIMQSELIIEEAIRMMESSGAIDASREMARSLLEEATEYFSAVSGAGLTCRELVLGMISGFTAELM